MTGSEKFWDVVCFVGGASFLSILVTNQKSHYRGDDAILIFIGIVLLAVGLLRKYWKHFGDEGVSQSEEIIELTSKVEPENKE